MKISVIITTKNEETHIENALKSIKGQTYPAENIEVIVVDNNSTDKTKEIAGRYTDQIYNLGPERSAQRNFGVEKSTGEYFIFIDADMILSENVIDNCVKMVTSDPDIIGIYVSEIIMGTSLFNQIRRFERSFYDQTPIDCVRFIKKESFQQAGGFDEKLFGGEDWDLNKRLKLLGKTGYIKTPVHHNESQLTLMRFLQKKDYYIKSLDDYINKWDRNDPDIKKQFSAYYRFFGVFIENGKWKKAIKYPHFAIGVLLMKFIVGMKFLLRK